MKLNKILIEAKVYGEVQEDEGLFYQNFRIVTSDFKFLKYFVDEKFIGCNALNEEMEKHYIGNGESIIFIKKIVFNNLITIVYKRAAFIQNIFERVQFIIKTSIPFEEGCSCCSYWKEKNRRCMYYSQFGINKKKVCQDFKQKEEKYS